MAGGSIGPVTIRHAEALYTAALQSYVCLKELYKTGRLRGYELERGSWREQALAQELIRWQAGIRCN